MTTMRFSMMTTWPGRSIETFLNNNSVYLSSALEKLPEEAKRQALDFMKAAEVGDTFETKDRLKRKVVFTRL